jgi:hypothetical protein
LEELFYRTQFLSGSGVDIKEDWLGKVRMGDTAGAESKEGCSKESRDFEMRPNRAGVDFFVASVRRRAVMFQE